MMCVVVGVVDIHRVRRLGKHLDHRMHTEPGNSSNDQCYAHECCRLWFWVDVQARDRSHHPQDSLHNHIHPRRIPHMRLDMSKNFSAWTLDAAPTMNFCFDSHWQQSHSIRSSYISGRMYAESTHIHQQLLRMYASNDVAERAPRVHRKIHGLLQMATPQATATH